MIKGEISLNSSSPAAVIVLAAGAGTRMKSALPKVLHPMGGRSLVGHALDAAASLKPEHLVAVVRHDRDRVVEHLLSLNPDLTIADQDAIPGTGRAVEVGLEAIGSVTGTVVVTYGDVPLLTPETLAALVTEHQQAQNAITILTANVPDATGYGRIVRDDNGLVTQIVEHKDALKIAEDTGDTTIADITEINSGIYAFDGEVLARTLAKVTTDNVQGEKYLTDVLGLARAEGGRVATYVTNDILEVEGVNDRVQLSALRTELNRLTTEYCIQSRDTLVKPSNTSTNR